MPTPSEAFPSPPEFRAFYGHDGKRGEQHEVSSFVREGRRWRYVAAVT